MNRIGKLSIFLTVMAFSLPVVAQMSYGGHPHVRDAKKLNDVQIVHLPYVSNEQCLREDELESMKGRPYRVGVAQDVHVTNAENGTWDTLPGGDKLWRVEFVSDEARFLYPVFEKYNIPEGAELFVYTSDQSFVLGKFTSQNSDEGKFHTQALPGESIVVEYFEPYDAEFSGELEISQIHRGHHDIFRAMGDMTKGGIGDAEGDCHINVACPTASGWQAQKNGVVCIGITTRSASYVCSGSMINNTRQDGAQYLLSASHCQEDITVTRWTFYFLYEASTCAGTTGPTNKSATGGTILAHKEAGNTGTSGSDFLLLKVTGTINPAYNVYFNGWDRRTANLVGSCIHHPGGDLKKISIPSSVSSANSYFWVVNWINGTNNKGVTEQGSSGSPLFNANKLIVGQLWSGASACDYKRGQDYYGKISASWTGGGTNSTRLSNWLDPRGTGATYLNGIYASDINPTTDIYAPKNDETDLKLFPNPAEKFLNVELNETGVAEYSITNESGSVVKQGRMFLGLNAYELDVTGLQPGTYVLAIDVDGRHLSHVFVKK